MTVVLQPGESAFAPEQEPPNEQDQHFAGDARKSVFAPRDLVPVKPRPEVMLVGHAFAPGGVPVRALVARLSVGDVDKSIEVFCDRTFNAEGVLQEGARFAQMPLNYERAAGGPWTSNPVGVRQDARDLYGRRALPNLQPVGTPAVSLEEVILPVGFGPIAESWPSRLEKLDRHADSFAPGQLRDRPLPEGLDLGYFNQAPPDQLLSVIRDNERIVLENLHREHARLVTSLPGLSPVAFVDRGRGTPQQLTMRADTLCIDADRGIATVTWRGQLPLERRDEAGRVVVGMESPGREMTSAKLDWDTAAPQSGSASERAARPENGATAGASTSARRGELTYAAGTVSRTIVPGLTSTPSSPALPFAPGAKEPDREEPRSSSPSAGLPFQSISLSAPPQSLAPLASLTPMVSPPPLASLPSLTTSSASAPGEPWKAPPPAPPIAAINPLPPAPKPEPAAQALEPGEIIELCWYDPKIVARVRQHWRELCTDLEFEPDDPRHDLPSEDPAEAKDRYHVFGLLAKGTFLDPGQVAQALDEATGDDGRFTPPLALVHGELRFLFDEVETLRATLAVISPFIVTDKKMKELVDEIEKIVKTPYLQGSTGLVDKLTLQVREQFTQSSRPITGAQMEACVERILLEQRKYQIRKLFGGEFIRAQLADRASRNSPVPVYLPKSLEWSLPVVSKVRAKILGEIHRNYSSYETATSVIRGCGLATTTQRTTTRRQ